MIEIHMLSNTTTISSSVFHGLIKEKKVEVLDKIGDDMGDVIMKGGSLFLAIAVDEGFKIISIVIKYLGVKTKPSKW